MDSTVCVKATNFRRISAMPERHRTYREIRVG
jgi:hypothetical protein